MGTSLEIGDGSTGPDAEMFQSARRLWNPGCTIPTPARLSEKTPDIDRGRALKVLSKPTRTDSPGSNTISSFHVTREFPLVTLVTMLAPTPDWFTGVCGLSLLDEQGDWLENKVVALYPFDAGTQQNLAFALHQPPEPQRRPIYSLSRSGCFTSEPVGSFTFTRIK